MLCSPWTEYDLERDTTILAKLFEPARAQPAEEGVRSHVSDDGDESSDGNLSERSCDSEAESEDFHPGSTETSELRVSEQRPIMSNRDI